MRKIILAFTAISFVSIGSIAYSTTMDNTAGLKQNPRMTCLCNATSGCACAVVKKYADGSVRY